MSPDNSGVKAEFDRAAKTYDSVRLLMIPCFDDFYGTVARVLPFEPGDAFDALDLGAGTGLLSALLHERFPKARLRLVDISDEMLARARERFAGASDVRIAVSDYSVEPLPGKFDAIVSALSIHHLDDPGKAALFRRIHDALKPGGKFVNADEVLAPTAALDALYWDEWERQARAAGAPEEEFAGVEERAKYDRPREARRPTSVVTRGRVCGRGLLLQVPDVRGLRRVPPGREVIDITPLARSSACPATRLTARMRSDTVRGASP